MKNKEFKKVVNEELAVKVESVMASSRLEIKSYFDTGAIFLKEVGDVLFLSTTHQFVEIEDFRDLMSITAESGMPIFTVYDFINDSVYRFEKCESLAFSKLNDLFLNALEIKREDDQDANNEILRIEELDEIKRFELSESSVEV